MNDYSIALYLHIVGALGFFVTLGLEWTGLVQIRNATSADQVRAWTRIPKSKGVSAVGFASMLAMVLTGIYMVVRVWGGIPWVVATIGALVLEIVLFVAVAGPRLNALERALEAEKGTVISSTIRRLANHPLLSLSVQTRVAIALGIVFLKVAKPDLTGSLFTIGIAIALGLVSALPTVRAERPQEGLAE